MPFNASGTFSRLHNWQQDRDSGIRITADRHDAEDDNFAAALNQTFLRNGVVPMTGNIQMGGYKIVALGSGAAAQPGITFTDLDTGIYQPATAQIGFAIDATHRGLMTSTAFTYTGNIIATGALQSATLATTGNATIGGSVAVTGNTTLTDVSTGNLSVSGGTNLNTLSTSGNATVGGTLGVTGNTTLTGLSAGATVASSLNVTGDTTLSNATATGNVSIGGTLAVAGATTLAALTATSITVLGLTGYAKANGASAFTASPTIPFADTTGTVPVNRGGTGQTSFVNGELLIGNTTGNTLSKATLTAGTNVTITNGPGTIIINASLSGGAGSGSVTSVDVSGGTTGLTTTGGPVTVAGTITLGGTLNAANGGTGHTAYAVGDILYASGATALSKLAAAAIGNVLLSGGVGAAPSYGKVGLTSHVTGTLPAGSGGTGFSNYTTGDLIIGGPGASLTLLAASGIGNVLLSGGVGAAPAYGKVGLTTHVTGTLPVSSGGTGQTSFVDGEILIGNTVGNTLNKTTLTAGSGVSITNGAGTITIAATGGGGTVTSVGLSGGTTGLNVSGSPVTGAGSMTLSGTLNVANGGTGQTTFTNGQLLIGNSTGNTLAKATLTQGTGITITNGAGAITVALTSPVTAITGGTGQTVYAVGDLLYASTTTALSKLADIATGNVLLSGGVNTAPAYGKVGLTTHVTGTLPVANGGTGAATLTGYVKGTGTTAMTAAATIPVGDLTGTLGVANGGTGAATLTGYVKGAGTSALTASATIPLTDTSGTLAVNRGGTGDTTYTNGQLLIGNTTGNTLTKGTLTAGTGISITNGAGSITIAATGAGWTQIGATLTPSTNMAEFTGIPQTYTELMLIATGVSHNNGTSTDLQVQVQDGTTWSAAVKINTGSALAAATINSAVVNIPGYTKDIGVISSMVQTPWPTSVSLGPTFGTDNVGTTPFACTGGIDGLRLLWGAGNYDAGTVALFGR